MNLKQELYIIFENPRKHKYGTIIQVAIFLNIFISIAVLFLQTEKSLSDYFSIFSTINLVNVLLFTLEYILRVYSITYKPRLTRIKYVLRPFMIIDLIAILPFYLSLFNLDFGFLRALRILRIFKLFRLAKFGEFDNLISSIIKEKKEEFLFITVVLFVLLLTITPLVYYFEKDAQPEVFTSMITTMWWAVITFTTVGYGDMYPITVMGRILTTIVSFLGIAFYAIPGSIFTSALLEKINEKKLKKYKKQREEND
ncbi:ion transporter [Arcobacter sp. YIC-464]|uniref:ion transporter n=1 Tax=Arcobacter sp. YIC-464 TaxID=3376631 RepID=UPI003C29A381